MLTFFLQNMGCRSLCSFVFKYPRIAIALYEVQY